jgi:hypothetical protein
VSEVPLTGLSAENPLAFLAAIGALSFVDEGTSDITQMGWRATEGTWVPFLVGERLRTPADVTSVIQAVQGERERSGDLNEELGWSKDVMKLTRVEFRELLQERSPDSQAAWLVASCLAELPPRRDGVSIPYTPLRLIPRVGRARFLEVAMRESKAGADHIDACLFEQWTYVSGVQSMRWDPAAPVPARALLAQAPTHLGTRGAPGTIMLAIRGLASFPLITARRSSARSAWRQHAVPPGMTNRNRFIWPIWNEALELPMVRALLSMKWLHELDDDRHWRRERAAAQLRAHGIVARFAAPRVTRGDDDEALGWGVPTVLQEDS